MRNTIFTSVSACLIALCSVAQSSLEAQNIKESVQVTNDYHSAFDQFDKQSERTVIPDSLYRFDYSFDYSVFDTPYKGSYDFTPYNVSITPSRREDPSTRFYLRAGAGVSPRPVLGAVYTPLSSQRASLSLYNYGSGVYTRSFYDFSDRLGVGGKLLSKAGNLDYNLAYHGIFAGSGSYAGGTHSASASMAFTSAASPLSFFKYDVGIDYNYCLDVNSVNPAAEHRFNLFGSIGPNISEKYAFLIDYDFTMASSSLAVLKPHLLFDLGIFDVDAGLKVNYAFVSSKGTLSISPSLNASVDVLKGALKAGLFLQGGRRLNTLYSLKSFNPFYVSGSDIAPLSTERYNAGLSLDGRLFQRLQYSFKGGYASRSGAVLDSYLSAGSADYRVAYADFSAAYLSERLNANALISFKKSYFDPSASPLVYAPAALRADIGATYNFLKRLYLGLGLEFSSARSLVCADAALLEACGFEQRIRPYADLALNVEWFQSKQLSVWGTLGNLLFQQISRRPGCIEKGPYVTLGVSWRI